MCPCLQAFEWVLEEWWIQTNAPSELSRHLSGDITACIRPGVGHPPMFCCDNQMSLKTQTGIIIMAFRTQGQHQECNGFVTVNRCHSYRQLCLLFPNHYLMSFAFCHSAGNMLRLQHPASWSCGCPPCLCPCLEDRDHYSVIIVSLVYKFNFTIVINQL